ncbi:MAG TPA: ATP-binding protein [Candidatus Limnocylindria bacterium]|nr:ATP-binding protein [Candidatus Limnocylindria bacterium]
MALRKYESIEAVSPGHSVQFYERESFLLDSLTDYIGSALRAAAAGIVIATPPHRDGLAQRLSARGVDVVGAGAQGRYVALDARDTLTAIMVDGWPDPARFDDTIGALVSRTRERAPNVYAFGEMVALLWAEGNSEAAIRLEELWNELATRQPFSLLCAYPIESFRDSTHAKPFSRMSATHSSVIPAESYMQLEEDEQLRVIAQLQQQAAALEAETIQRRHAEAELHRRVAQLADADRRKDEFLAMLGHELRNPLAPVTTALQLMRMHSDEPLRVARARETIERQVEHMTRLIDDLLDVSRITQGKIELRQEAVILSTLVARAVEAARPVIDERGHRLTLDLPDEPVVVRGDPARLEQVLANLLNNAAKYTDVGGRISVRAFVDGAQLAIAVRDNGAGLSPEMRDRVFDLFVQGPDMQAYARGGLGIGLTLARRLVEMHGGTIEVHSEGSGRGSEFVVRLPIGAVPQIQSNGHTDEATLSALPKRRVLVVDDNVDAADALAELLRDYGHDVRSVHDGPSAIEQAALHRPDIVLLDIGMPGFDGYEVARRMRTELGLKATLVAVTGYGEARHRRQSRDAGFDQHVTKPVDTRKLETLLKLPN